MIWLFAWMQMTAFGEMISEATTTNLDKTKVLQRLTKLFAVRRMLCDHTCWHNKYKLLAFPSTGNYLINL